VGLPMEHNAKSAAPVLWRYCNIATHDKDWVTVERLLDNFAENAPSIKADLEATSAQRRSASQGRNSRCRKVRLTDATLAHLHACVQSTAGHQHA
jgi:hypothetical protein